MFADLVTDPVPVVASGGVVLLLATMLKMLWADRTRGARIEAALRTSFAKERVDREAEYVTEKATAKADYSESLARHKEIHDREIAGYVAQLGETQGRVTVLEARVVALDTEVAKLRKQ